MSPDTPLRTNQADVTAKVLDGEAVIINFTTSVYYTLTGAGAYAWELFERGCTPAIAAARVAARYQASPTDVASHLATLIPELMREGLLVAADRTDSAPEPGASPPTDGYVQPVLTAYRDMSDILALDPPLPELRPVALDRPETGAG